VGEEKVNIQELAQKVDQLLNILKVVSADLAEVSKSLKTVTVQKAPPAVSSVSAPHVEKKYDLNGVKQAFSSELAGMLLFEETGKFVVVKPRRFLGSDNFSKVASVVRELGGEYVSAGKNSHFKIEKK
jgi:hypothetical protein